jgi:O-antigen/teichoic acid export membrane protein
VAFHHAAGDTLGVVGVIHSATALYALLGMGLLALTALAWPLLAGTLFHGAPPPVGGSPRLVLGSVAVLALTFTIGGLAALVEGLQRIVLSNWIRAAAALAQGATAFLLLGAGWGLRALVSGAAAAVVVRAVALALIVPALEPAVARWPLAVSRARMRELVGSSAKLAVVQLSGFAHYQAPKVLLAVVAPIASVGIFDIVASQMQRAQNLLTGLVYPFLPALAESAGGGPGAVERGAALYALSHRMIAMLVVPFLAAVVVFAPTFVALWLGAAYAPVAPAFVVAAVGTSALVLSAPAHYLLVGYGAMRVDVERAVLGIAVTLVGALLGARMAGVHGALLGSTLGAGVAVLWLYVRARHMPVARAAAGAVRDAYVRSAVATLPAAAVAALAVRALPTTWRAFVAAVVAFALALALGLVAVGLVPRARLRAAIATLVGWARTARASGVS